jgi:hypothetical protein
MKDVSMSSEDELRDVLKGAAKSIAEQQRNPRAWLSWIIYLLARLEESATNDNPADKQSYNEMLNALRDEIRNRTNTGGWQ